MSKTDELTRAYCLAHLKTGKSPKEVSEILDVSYAQALKLKKELIKAEESDALESLFKLPEAALLKLVEKAEEELTPVIEALTEEVETKEIVGEVVNGVKGLGRLETELQDAAIEITKKISMQAVSTSSSDTLAMLADALAKINSSFFAKGTNVQVNNVSGGFERYLKD